MRLWRGIDATINCKSVLENLQESNYNGPITLEICYRNRYLDISLEDFYKKAYAVGRKLM